ncbi:ribonuclease inhibitor-like [Engraulis encrasicolus]|uniref:ribonuclease inhibitor-like n=1 Tax=Engraulis encrasicolus TaxID=184585 RepID=UPI002FD226A5
MKKSLRGAQYEHVCHLSRLSDCSIRGKGYAALATALKSNPSHLEELDLRGNDPRHAELKLLTDLLQDPACKLKSLRVLGSDTADEALVYLTSVLGGNPLLLTELDLRGKIPGDSGVKQFCALLEDSQYRVEKLRLGNCSITGEGCAALISALTSNPSHLKELHLNDNVIGDSGLKQISTLLRNPDCKLQRLGLKSCSITEAGGTALASALSSNPSSHLIELDLDNNKLGDSGVKQISTLLRNPCCKLQTLGLSDCGVTGEGYAALATALKSNPSHLEELDLRGNDPGHSEVKLLTDLVEDPTYKLQRLRLLSSGAADVALVYLTAVLGGNPLLLTELDLRGKISGDSGVKQLCALLEDPHCRFKKVNL